MANTYTKILLHVVFAVKHRDASISPLWATELYSYFAAALRNHGSYALEIGGIENHVHIFFDYNPKVPLPDMIRDMKSFSSKFINEHHILPCRFEWQRGYACFSYSASQIDAVKRYIQNQYEHHRGCSLADEVKNMLSKFGIDYDERYIFADAE